MIVTVFIMMIMTIGLLYEDHLRSDILFIYWLFFWGLEKTKYKQYHQNKSTWNYLTHLFPSFDWWNASLGFVCFVVLNPCVLSVNRVDLGFFLFFFDRFSNFTPPQTFLRFLLTHRLTCGTLRTWAELALVVISRKRYTGGGWQDWEEGGVIHHSHFQIIQATDSFRERTRKGTLNRIRAAGLNLDE